MKKKFLSLIAALIFIAFGVFNVNISNNNHKGLLLTSTSLENIEALAGETINCYNLSVLCAISWGSICCKINGQEISNGILISYECY